MKELDLWAELRKEVYAEAVEAWRDTCHQTGLTYREPLPRQSQIRDDPQVGEVIYLRDAEGKDLGLYVVRAGMFVSKEVPQ